MESKESDEIQLDTEFEGQAGRNETFVSVVHSVERRKDECVSMCVCDRPRLIPGGDYALARQLSATHVRWSEQHFDRLHPTRPYLRQMKRLEGH